MLELGEFGGMRKNQKTIFFLSISVVLLIAVFSSPVLGKNENGLSRFYPARHNQINNDALEKVLDDLKIGLDQKQLKRWKKLLNKALWHQDLFDFFSSRHHFDNCCFAEGIEQINQHLQANEKDYLRLQNSPNQKERNRLNEKIIFRTGRILHSVQDFFSHSSYVEMMQEKFPKIEEVSLPDFLTKAGQEIILQLITEGLVSEKFFFSFPHRCSAKSTFYNHLGKDSPKQAGGKKTTVWLNSLTNKNFNGYEAATYFAQKTTYQILLQTLGKYPLLIVVKQPERS